ncbi:MAG: MFS transporter [Christensenellales bacterium]|jgi:sugar (glycoside-pentoside-hexuronide) transporter|nr:glycoside-pentoside-hexuronide (GPH):cation symporter [Clostridia bacterium]HRU84479.1 glycoside-pentoside-hexuronide (GPH):cation symporter [Eubacteriales bacterium]
MSNTCENTASIDATTCEKAVSIDAKMSPRTRWTYCFGGIGRDMAYSLFSGHMLTFIMLTRQIDAAMQAGIGIVMIICRIWDAFNDPIMGSIIENTRGKYGKFKPWILIGAITNAIILVIMFTTKLQGWSFIIFFGLMFLLWDITFTMNDIGYWSMLPALTSNRADRDFTTSWANLLAGVGGGLGFAVIPFLTAGAYAIGGNAVTAYAVVSVIIAVCFIGCQVMTVLGVKEKAAPPPPPKVKGEGGLKKMFKVIAKNDQLLWVALIMLIYNLGGAGTQMLTMYIYLQFGYEGYFAMAFSVIFGISTGIPMILYSLAAKKFKRRQILHLSIILIVFGYLCFFLTGVAWPMNFFVLAAWGIFISIGQGFFYNILTISISNTVEYNEWRTGKREEAIIFSMRPLMAKLGTAIQIAIVTGVYFILGIRNITNGISEYENQVHQKLITAAEKTEKIKELIATAGADATFWLRACIAFIPLVLIFIAYIIYLAKFKIDEEKYAVMINEISEARAKNLGEPSEEQICECGVEAVLSD